MASPSTPPPPGPAALAASAVVRDEERFLPAWLAYHRALGVGRFYMYLDRCRDRTADILAAAPDATVFDLAAVAPEAGAFWSPRQTVTMNHAKALALAEGFPWLLCLDADEFAYGGGYDDRARRPGRDAERCRRAGSLPSMLARVPDGIDLVVLETWEAVPTHDADDAFWSLHWMKPSGAPFARKVVHPLTGKSTKSRSHWGHDLGKTVIRTASGWEALYPHDWGATGGRTPDAPRRRPPAIALGRHYHYTVCGPRHWQEKFGRHSEYAARWKSGAQVSFTKQAWKEGAAAMDETQADAYFHQQLSTPLPTLLRTWRRGGVVPDATVEAVLRSAGFPPAHGRGA